MNNSKKARIRQAQIRDMLQKADVITINEFCEKLDASIATIRNDLTYLEKGGYLKRVLGGAISTEGTPRNTVFSSRMNLYKREKKEIAKYIVDNIIKMNMTIILDAGTTCHFIAEYLLEKEVPCKVLTNAFNIVSILSKSQQIQVFSAGGKLDKEHNAYYDLKALEPLKKQEADVYFLSPNGIDLKHMVTGSSKEENKIKKAFIEMSKQVIVTADYSKFEKEAKYFLLDLKNVSHIIVDKHLSTDKVNEFAVCESIKQV